MPRKLIAANWKENPRSKKLAFDLFRAVAKVKTGPVEVAVCPPFIYLEGIAELRRRMLAKRVSLGAQDVFWEERGPYTSEIGPKMLKSLGVKYIIVGHSERRKWMKETDRMVNKKIKLALADGLRVILCVGEPLAARKKGIAAARRFIERQLKKDIAGVRGGGNIVVAYEPIWAIGTGRNDRPEDARDMASFIKGFVKMSHHFSPRVLYGGSVNSRNVADYIQWKEVDGALVGGASQNAVEFKKIINHAKHANIK